jgi:hypothetical protein
MIIYAATSGYTIHSGNNSFSIDFVPTLNISNKECWLKVEQFFMHPSTTGTSSETFTVVRCNLTQPHSQAFTDSSAIGNNSVIYIRNVQSPWPAAPILVYVPDGPQQILFTLDTSVAQANAVRVGMLISLVAASN